MRSLSVSSPVYTTQEGRRTRRPSKCGNKTSIVYLDLLHSFESGKWDYLSLSLQVVVRLGKIKKKGRKEAWRVSVNLRYNAHP
jgi:hypothetical protein